MKPPPQRSAIPAIRPSATFEPVNGRLLARGGVKVCWETD
jgi:hypothetical protein